MPEGQLSGVTTRPPSSVSGLRTEVDRAGADLMIARRGVHLVHAERVLGQHQPFRVSAAPLDRVPAQRGPDRGELGW